MFAYIGRLFWPDGVNAHGGSFEPAKKRCEHTAGVLVFVGVNGTSGFLSLFGNSIHRAASSGSYAESKQPGGGRQEVRLKYHLTLA